MIDFEEVIDRKKEIEIKNDVNDTEPSKVVIQKYGLEAKFKIGRLTAQYFSYLKNFDSVKFKKLNIELRQLTDKMKNKNEEEISIEDKNKLSDIMRQLNELMEISNEKDIEKISDIEFELMKYKFNFGVVSIDGKKVKFEDIKSVYVLNKIVEELNIFNNEEVVESVKKN